MTEPVVRAASRADGSALNAIYNRYIVGSHVSFDTAAWTDAARTEWLTDRLAAGYPVLVAEIDGTVVGGSWAGPWRTKEAYRWSAETTIVLHPDATGRGLGRTLYGALLDELAKRGFHRAFAIIALPNDASVALHERLGFTQLGTLDEAGFKDGRWISTMLLERRLASGERDPGFQIPDPS
ncbi:MAG: N-acetyltransferase [Acidimicrobiia bacterium]|nr:N-acetyltransferase [Acidimicrobiia bacterium]